MSDNQAPTIAASTVRLFVSFKTSSGFGNAVIIGEVVEPKSMDDVEELQDLIKSRLGWIWRWRKLLILWWKVLDANT